MNIAMIGHKRIPGREGGVEVVVEELATRMAALGHCITAYNRKKRGCRLPAEYKGVQIIEVPTIEKKSTDAVVYAFFASVRALFGHYDVVHYHALGPSVFLLLPHLFGIKTVVTVHGLNYLTPKWTGVGAAFIKLGEKIAARYADTIIVLSRGQQEYFRQAYGRETQFIPNGTALKEIVEADLIKKEYGLQKNGYLLFVSRVVPGKGLEYLLQAYRHIKCDLPLVVAGGSVFVDDFYKRIEQMAAQDERVKLIGFAEGQKLQELYSNAALFVFPSEAEGMPMCLLEALSYNCRCLVSDIPENTEVGGSYVQAFRSCDVQSLREKLQLCLTQGDTLFCGDSRSYVRQKYNWDAVTQQTLQIYEG